MKQMVILLSLLFSQSLYAMQVDLELTDLEGKQFKLSDYRGKWVVLNYWATWCPPCLEELQELVLFHENHKESDAVVIGVDMEVLQPETLRQFVDDNFVTYPVVPLVKKMQSFDDVVSLPTTFIIDPNGVSVLKHIGPVTANAIEAFISARVNAQSASR